MFFLIRKKLYTNIFSDINLLDSYKPRDRRTNR